MNLTMQGICKSFGANNVLQDVDFSLKTGEICALLGENGAGKSTLMNILGGVLPADKGVIELDGKPVKKPKVEVLEDRGGSGTLSIVIHEGRNRQVRRMCEQAGLKVKRLIRVREGELSLGRLRRGEWRTLDKDELELLLR